MTEAVAWCVVLVTAAVTELALAHRKGGEPSPVGRLTDSVVQPLTVIAIVGPPINALVLAPGPVLLLWFVGLAIGLAGIVLRVAAMATLGVRYQLTPREVASAMTIIDRGPFAVIRHPGYCALLLLFSGLALMSGGLIGLVFVVPLVLGVILRIFVEERLLFQEFGEKFVRYREAVRWKLIPRVL